MHALDNPGVGSERGTAAPLSLRATSAHLLRRFAALRAAQGVPHDEPFGVLGVSMGGMLALDIAAHSAAGPAHCGVVAAVIVNSSGSSAPLWRRFTPLAVRAMLRGALLPRRAREAAMLRVTVRDETRAAQLLPAFCALAEARPLPLRTLMSQLLAIVRWRAPAAVPVPVLVARSLGDELCHPECSAALARSLASPLRSHPSAGHDLPAEDPAWLASTVRAWLDAGMPRHAD